MELKPSIKLDNRDLASNRDFLSDFTAVSKNCRLSMQTVEEMQIELTQIICVKFSIPCTSLFYLSGLYRQLENVLHLIQLPA